MTDHSDTPICPGPDCPMCNGEVCERCGAGSWNNGLTYCTEDTIVRHEPMDVTMMGHGERCARWREHGQKCTCGAQKAPWERVAD